MSATAAAADENRRRELAAFLQRKRRQLSPDEVGISPTSSRRVAGLRREEVAHLAGVSMAWYVKLEQGKAGRPSYDVVDSLCRALRLNGDECRYLHRLAAHRSRHAEPLSDDLSVLRTLVRQLLPLGATVETPWADFLTWNSAYVELFQVDPAKLPEGRRNGLWSTFVASPSPTLQDRGAIESARVRQLRFEASEHGDDPRFQRTVDYLSAASERFHKLWSSHEVQGAVDESELEVRHPVVGAINLIRSQLRPLGGSIQRLTVYMPASDLDRARMTVLLEQR